MRAARAVLNLLTALLVTTVVTVALALYLAIEHRNLPLLHALVGYLGRVMQGQRIERMDIDVRVEPSSASMSGTATLDIRALDAGRSRFYALLNDGLRVEQVSLEDSSGSVTMPHYRLGPLLVMASPRAVAADETIHVRVTYSGSPLSSQLAGSRPVMNPRDVILKPEHLWYPTDLQGFFNADLSVTLPASLQLIHGGAERERLVLGQSARVRWSTARPVAGVGLVAGPYTQVSSSDEGVRATVAQDVQLDSQTIAAAAGDANRLLTEMYGGAGFETITVAVSRAVARGFNDGSGLIVLSPQYFHDGNYGFPLLAHEIAHNWWGGTVAEKWLSPGTGGEWIVEGFAELSALRAIEQHSGHGALLRRLETMGFDPTSAATIEEMSALDNAVNPFAHAVIYGKGPLVARLLQNAVGDEGFANAMRQILERYRYRQIGDHDVEAVVTEVTNQDLKDFFTTWVRSNAMLDLALDPNPDGGAVARNHGTAWAPAKQILLRQPAAGEAERETLDIGATATLNGAGELILDPDAAAPDVYRGNNVFPPRHSPRSITISSRGELLVVYGNPGKWSPLTASHLSASGQVLHEWDIDRGLLTEPVWTADGVRALYAESDRNGVVQLVALNTADGSQTAVAHDAAASPIANGLIVARGDRLLRLEGKSETTIARQPGRTLSAPQLSPDQAMIAYSASNAETTDLRIVGANGSNDRLVLTWPSAAGAWRWSPDGARLFAALPGDWDWQLWEIPVGAGDPRALVREAAAINDIAVSADGQRIALTAVPTLDDANARAEVFIVNLQGGAPQRFAVEGQSVERVAWLSSDELLAVTAERDVHALPRRRQLLRLSATDGSSRAFP